jgi:hypothetical protein
MNYARQCPKLMHQRGHFLPQAENHHTKIFFGVYFRLILLIQARVVPRIELNSMVRQYKGAL